VKFPRTSKVVVVDKRFLPQQVENEAKDYKQLLIK
jgi:hypothetical protein